MMEETKIGKNELIAWVEELTNKRNFDFKNLKDGDIYLRLFELIWPKVMKKYKNNIYINPKNDTNRRKNWKLIKNILQIVNIDTNFINYEGIVEDNFKACYQSLVILYFLYSLVKFHECDFVLAYPIDQKLTNFMSSEDPLTCLVKAGSVQLPEVITEQIANSNFNFQLNKQKEQENKERETNTSKTSLRPKSNASDLHLNDLKTQEESTRNYKDILNQTINESIIDNNEYNNRNERYKSYERNEFSDKEEESIRNVYQKKNVYNENDAYNMRRESNNQIYCSDTYKNKMNFLNGRENFYAKNGKYVNEENTEYLPRGSDDNWHGNNTELKEKGFSYYTNTKQENCYKYGTSLNKLNDDSNILGESNNLYSPSMQDNHLLNENSTYINEQRTSSHLLKNINSNISSHLLHLNKEDYNIDNIGFKYGKDRRDSEHIDSILEGRKNISLPNLDLFKHPFNKTVNDYYENGYNRNDYNNNNTNNNNNNNLNSYFSRIVKKEKVDFCCQTEKNEQENIFLELMNDDNINFEIVWNDQNKKIKGDSFIFFLKTQIKMYKKELSAKKEEIELMKKINKKNISDMKAAHILEMKKLKEKHESEIAYLKQQHIENIVIVRKNFELKLNNIEEDLLLDLDVLNSENKNIEENDMEIESDYGKGFVTSNIQTGNTNYNLYNKVERKNDYTNSDLEHKEYCKWKDLNENGDIKNEKKETREIGNDIGNRAEMEAGIGTRIRTEDKSCRNAINNLNIESSIRKLKYLLHEKNKEHLINNDFIKTEIISLRGIINKIKAEKEKDYTNQKENNEVFNEILQTVEINDESDFSNNLNKDAQIEKIKNSIHAIIKKRKENNNNRHNIQFNNDDTINHFLNENVLLNLIVHIGSLLHLERIRSEGMKIQREKNNFMMNYLKTEKNQDFSQTRCPTQLEEGTCIIENNNNNNNNNINNHIFSNEIHNNEIENFEKSMETDEKIKKLENKNRKLLSMNEYYKKKLEHVEIWKSNLEIFQKKSRSYLTTSNNASIPTKNDKNNNIENDKEGIDQNNITNENKGIEQIYPTESCFSWIPEFYLKTFEEESERDAYLMYLLKKLGRYEKDQELCMYEKEAQRNFALEKESRLEEKNMNRFYLYGNNHINPRMDISENRIKITNVYEYGNNEKCFNYDLYDEQNMKTEKEDFSFLYKNEFLVVLKKKLTYIFWQMIGDIYKYKNIIYEACQYIANLNNIIKNIIEQYEQTKKKEKEKYELFCKTNENLFLSEKYKLRKIIGITQLNMEICKEECLELKENFNKEKKNFMILTNACYESESLKYKTTIQKFKEIDKMLKTYKIREKKWNKLVKLLTAEIKKSSKNTQEEIKNVWLELLATNRNIDTLASNKANQNQQMNDNGNVNGSGNHTDSDESNKFNASMGENYNEENYLNIITSQSNKNKIKKGLEKKLFANKNVNEKLQEVKKGNAPKNNSSERNDTTVNNKENNDKKIINTNIKNDKMANLLNCNNDIYSVSSKTKMENAKNENEINFYQNDFITCLDDIENNDMSFFCSTNEMEESTISEKDNILVDLQIDERFTIINTNNSNNKENVNDKKNQLHSNDVLKIISENSEKDSLLLNKDQTTDNKINANSTDDILAKKKQNWFTLLSQMAKESCVMFQKVLNSKEEELNDKKKKNF